MRTTGLRATTGALLLILLAACSKQPAPPAAAPPPPADPVATTTAGKVRGISTDGIQVFKGIRYGASTEGRRFLPPEPPAPWTEVVDAKDYGNQAPQVAGPPVSLFKSWANPRELSEDMLFLNVWTPAPRENLHDNKPRPVLVWFHGGGFATGSGSSKAYDGTRLARRGDVVVVTVNHRLNAFGYLYLGGLSDDPALADSGNVGNLDMLLSLQWVRDNIAAFGGDPANVLIFGESGGGAKVSTLMGMPAAQGLFHKAVAQSGSLITARTKETATTSAKAFMEVLGLKADQVAELRTLPMAKILEGLDALRTRPDAGVGFGPVMDGRSLPRHPFEPDAPAVSANVPLLVGTVKDEMTMLRGAFDPTLFDLTWEELPKRLGANLKGIDVPKVVAGVRKLHPDATASDVFFKVTTELAFRNSAIKQAERKSAAGAAPAFMYQLIWETPVDGGKWKAPHALDVGLVFDNAPTSASMSGTGPEAQKVADHMSDAWLAFARTGNPGWPAYDTKTRATMMFDVESKVVNDPHPEDRALFGKLVPAGP